MTVGRKAPQIVLLFISKHLSEHHVCTMNFLSVWQGEGMSSSSGMGAVGFLNGSDFRNNFVSSDTETETQRDPEVFKFRSDPRSLRAQEDYSRTQTDGFLFSPAVQSNEICNNQCFCSTLLSHMNPKHWSECSWKLGAFHCDPLLQWRTRGHKMPRPGYLLLGLSNSKCSAPQGHLL